MEQFLPQAISIPIGDTPVLVAAVKINPPRKSISVRNVSSGGQVITVAFGKADLTSLAGYVLNPPAIAGQGGDGMVFSIDSAYRVWQGEIWAISSAADGVLVVVEET